VPCNRAADGTCLATTEHYATSEYRFEGGLRYHWNLFNQPIRPELLVAVQYGLHAFSIGKKAGADVGPPDVTYSYLDLGIGVRIPFAALIGLVLDFHYHAVLDTGSIQTQAEYGDGSAWGLRGHAAVEIHVVKGLTIRVAGFYEQFGLSFANDMMSMKSTMGGATDQFFGATLSVGYIF
jgi:hypothetical protein